MDGIIRTIGHAQPGVDPHRDADADAGAEVESPSLIDLTAAEWHEDGGGEREKEERSVRGREEGGWCTYSAGAPTFGRSRLCSERAFIGALL
jgi:hypothetical protein